MSREGSSAKNVSSQRKKVASERIALSVLEELGYRVIETNKRVELNGIVVGEVDVIAADDSGNLYAVEVKAGRLDIGGIRQAYVNSLLAGAKPMVVCKGFADEAARELAEKLEIKTILLSDIFLVENEELYTIVREVIEETLTDYLELFYGYSVQLKLEHCELLDAVYTSSNIDEAADKLNLDIPSLAKKIEDLKRQGIIPKWVNKYGNIRRIAQIILHRESVRSALEEARKLIEHVKLLEQQFKALQSTIASLNQQVSVLISYVSKLEMKIQQEDLS
ncbi:MAG: YraN family protein [Desulfurococcaceae archaeon]